MGQWRPADDSASPLWLGADVRGLPSGLRGLRCPSLRSSFFFPLDLDRLLSLGPFSSPLPRCSLRSFLVFFSFLSRSLSFFSFLSVFSFFTFDSFFSFLISSRGCFCPLCHPSQAPCHFPFHRRSLLLLLHLPPTPQALQATWLRLKSCCFPPRCAPRLFHVLPRGAVLKRKTYTHIFMTLLKVQPPICYLLCLRANVYG